LSLLSLALLTMAMPSSEQLQQVIWRRIAFLGRYGHQPAHALLRMPTTQLYDLARAVAELMREERDLIPEGD